MVQESSILIFLLLLPLCSFILLALFNKKLKNNGDYLGILSLSGCVIISVVLFYLSIMGSLADGIAGGGKDILKIIYKLNWLPVKDGINLPFILSYDALTSIMLVIVSIISLLVHIFSKEYMKGDKRYGRYYASLSLFSFSMIGLVLSYNLLFLYIFWELVGLSSYLLIGHFFEKKEACNASIKAFITTRVGDVAILIGILICYMFVGSLNFDDIYSKIVGGTFPSTYRTILGICLFIGAMGKSAQFPLHIWLPDAMQGPTPVSALIHAATMVAAGVYLVARLFFVFDESTLLFIAYIGGFTSVFSATIAIAQDDIKKVLAYSTISQLGLMMLGLGVGSVTGGIFHLMAHAFCKSGLFLGAGAIIFSMHHIQSMKEYGGLYKKLPIIAICYLCFTLSLCGFFPFSGFWSKDFILGDIVYFYRTTNSNFLLVLCSMLTTFLTPFYMFRQFFLVFLGKPRNMELYNNVRCPSKKMIVPLIVLAIFSIFAGGIIFGGKFGTSWFQSFFENDNALFVGFKNVSLAKDTALLQSSHHYVEIFSVIAVILSIFISSLFFYERKNGKTVFNPEVVRNKFSWIYNLLIHKYYIDELYKITVLKFLFCLSSFIAFFDNVVIDGIVNFSSYVTNKISNFIKFFDDVFVDGICVKGSAKFIYQKGKMLSTLQCGNVKEYLFYSFVGIFIISVLFLTISFNF